MVVRRGTWSSGRSLRLRQDRGMAFEDQTDVVPPGRKKGAGQPRSQAMVLAGYFLSRLTEADGTPPAILGVQRWHEAYELFRLSCGEGREATPFGRSLKNTRDAFDSHLGGIRVGWRHPNGGPNQLSAVEDHVLSTWAVRSDEDLVEAVEELLTTPVEAAPGDAEQLSPLRTTHLAEGIVLVATDPHGSSGDVQLKSPRRAGREKQIGDRAEALVRDYLLETLGSPADATVIHHAALGETPGYDLSYVRGGIMHCVEVKGTVGPTMASFVLTKNEWNAAEKHMSRYLLYLVSDVEGDRPRLQILEGPACAGADLVREPVAWQVRLP